MIKEQWRAIKFHDPAYDGKFFYATKSSKTVCRPSCHARSCSPDSVIIFDTLDDAIRAGYHPCSHCRPDLPEWRGAKRELAERAKAYIDMHFTEKFLLDKIAGELFVDKIYLSKCFKEITNDTLLHYHNRVRCEHACKLLSDSDLNIDLISNRVGYATSSHFARMFRSFYHCSPTEYRKKYFSSIE